MRDEALEILLGWQLGRGIDDQRQAVSPAHGGDRRQVDDAGGIGREAHRDDRRRQRRLDLPGFQPAHAGAGAAVVVPDIDQPRAGSRQRMRVAGPMRARQQDIGGDMRQRGHLRDVPARDRRRGSEGQGRGRAGRHQSRLGARRLGDALARGILQFADIDRGPRRRGHRLDDFRRAGLNTVQGPLALNTISGEPYADFGTMNTNSSMMFMNALGQQMANARGAAAAGQRQALAQACEIESCDAVGPLSAWASALGGLGSVLGDTNASTLTYNFGGAAAGIDYRLDPRFLVGIGVGYTHGTQWVNTFLGQGWSDWVSVAAYGSFTQGGFYVDALAGYAYFNNQLQRQILIPGLQQRTATGSTGANQFLGQIEGGYKLGVYAPAAATITPFGRFQISSVTQNAFTRIGRAVAQPQRGAADDELAAHDDRRRSGSSIGLGNERKLDLAVRLGWMHEFADTGRPITAAFAGAPGNSFTVFGATPLRNAAVVGLQATTTIAAATQIYLRYDGEIATGTDNHALNVGLRMSW